MSVLLGLGCLLLDAGGWNGKDESEYIVKWLVRKRPPRGLDRIESILPASSQPGQRLRGLDQRKVNGKFPPRRLAYDVPIHESQSLPFNVPSTLGFHP